LVQYLGNTLPNYCVQDRPLTMVLTKNNYLTPMRAYARATQSNCLPQCNLCKALWPFELHTHVCVRACVCVHVCACACVCVCARVYGMHRICMVLANLRIMRPSCICLAPGRSFWEIGFSWELSVCLCVRLHGVISYAQCCP
jgi:hypothetical protein